MEIIHGADDTLVSPVIHAANMIKTTDRAHLTLLPGIGHMPHHVAALAVSEAVDRAARRAGITLR